MTYFNAHYNPLTNTLEYDYKPIRFRAPTEQEKNAAWKIYGQRWVGLEDGYEYWRKSPFLFSL
jgi:hypothetical protein